MEGSVNHYGETIARIERREAERKAALLQTQQEERERNHRAWLRLCGMMSPIGKLSD